MMKNYHLILESEPNNSFHCIKAANSLDIDLTKKLKHELNINADVDSQFNIGLIVGNSGSGKTTLTKKIYGDDCFSTLLNENEPVINQFDSNLSYDERANLLNSVGLSQVVCWIRPAKTLSNGQKYRAEVALQIANTNQKTVVIDEWTSVVDRTVAKIMSNSLQKAARKYHKKFVLCSCHYDIIDWLQPDWIIDCNKQEYQDRRSLRLERTEKLEFTIRPCDRKTWKYFSKYHYLSDKLPGGTLHLFGLFHGENQIGFQCFANYVAGHQNIFHFNRTVIHPDYVGIGLSRFLINETSKYLINKYNYKIMGKFSSIPIYKMLSKDKNWKLVNEGVITPDFGTSKKQASCRNKSNRNMVKWFSFEFIKNK